MKPVKTNKTVKIEILTKPGVPTSSGVVYDEGAYQDAIDKFMKRENRHVTLYSSNDRILAGDVGTFVGDVISINDGYAEVVFYDNFKFNHEDFKLVTNGINSLGENSTINSVTFTSLELAKSKPNKTK